MEIPIGPTKSQKKPNITRKCAILLSSDPANQTVLNLGLGPVALKLLQCKPFFKTKVQKFVGTNYNCPHMSRWTWFALKIAQIPRLI